MILRSRANHRIIRLRGCRAGHRISWCKACTGAWKNEIGAELRALRRCFVVEMIRDLRRAELADVAVVIYVDEDGIRRGIVVRGILGSGLIGNVCDGGAITLETDKAETR